MSKEQITALQESIAHWERLRDGTQIGGECPYGDYCACCKLNNSFDDPRDCRHCPIYEFTGSVQCANTPYGEAALTFYVQHESFPEKAQDEIDFLKEVLSWVEAGKPGRES